MIKPHCFRMKKSFRMSALVLAAMAALALTGCSEGKMLSDKELVNVLSKKLGDKVEITEQEQQKGETLPILYSMKCADGTEFTVTRHKKRNGYFGSCYYEYDCDYLWKWVVDHDELNTVLDDKGLSHEDFSRGTMIIARNFEEVHTAVEAACTLVEDSSNRIPALTNIDQDYELKFLRPGLMVRALDGKYADSTTTLTEFEYQDGTEKIDYDEEYEIYNAEWEYVDNVRHDDIINVELPDEILAKYGPGRLEVMLLNRKYDLSRARNTGQDLPVETGENLYTVSDWCNVQQNEILDFPRLASFAECTGFKPYAADSKSYTLARGDEKVVFRFSESGSFAERNGVKTDLRGKIEISTTSYGFELTTDDLTKLFDTEFKLDLVNGTAEITNMKK